MQPSTDIIETLFNQAESFSKTTYELSKLKSVQSTSIIMTALVSKLSIIITLSVFLLVLNIGIALLLGELLGKAYYGFFIVAGIYLVAGLIMNFFLHKWIKRPFSELIITQSLH